MCGIAGIINLNKKRVDKNTLVKMAKTLSHRGPDDEGYFIEKNIALGHRRLSIIDLSKAGHQPMARENLVIVFNGEIYNYIEIKEELKNRGYRFKTQTDTEVILASYQEWGEECLKQFNGMWAFAIYDRKKNVLFCARDRLGVKPFYYFYDKTKFVFASEPKALLAHPEIKAQPNEQLVWDYLICGYLDHREETFFKGIKELRGGCYLGLENNNIKVKQYWNLPKKTLTISDYEAAAEFSRLLHESVKLRLRSDVPIGTCLSGGLDSSAIVCIVNDFLEKGGIQQIGRRPKTFSSVYDHRKYPDCDEKVFIREIIKKTKVNSYYIFPSGQKLRDELPDLIYSQDFPFGSTSVYAQWNVFRLASHYVKVMLDGQGSDELLAGYHTFFPVFFQSLREQKKYFMLFKELINYCRIHRQSFKGVLLMNFQTPFLKKLLCNFGLGLKSIYYSSYYDYSVFNQSWRNQFKPFDLPRPNNDPFLDKSYFLITTQGLPSLLRYEDRNSMAFSIESRTPFLDYSLVEFVYSLPDDQKIRNGQTKWVMRQALKGILPEKILTRQDKIGFATPEETWMKDILSPQMKSVFCSKQFAGRPYFDQEKVLASFDKYLEGEPILYQLFWRIYNLELWLRRFID